MTEHDRGAYTPQPDAPLQFDARGPRVRRPMPMTLIGSAAVLVVLLGALALHYRHDTKPEPTPAAAAEKVAQIKAPAPAAVLTPKEAGGPVDVFGGSAHDPSKSPTLAPPPETPKSRQQLTVQASESPIIKPVPTTATTVTTTHVTKTATPTTTTTVAIKAPTAPAKTSGYKAPGVTTIAAPAPTPAKLDGTQVVESVAAQTPTKSALGKAAPVTAKTTGLATAAPTVKPAATAKALAPTAKPAAGGAVVQIGAFSSASLSDKGWSDVSSAMAASMGGKTKRVEVVEKDGKTFYRTSVTGFASRAAADSFCKALAAKGKACFAKG